MYVNDTNEVDYMSKFVSSKISRKTAEPGARLTVISVPNAMKRGPKTSAWPDKKMNFGNDVWSYGLKYFVKYGICSHEAPSSTTWMYSLNWLKSSNEGKADSSS